MIAFYGMGLLGSNFTRALIERGETVHVWNRTASKARALEADGAVVFDDPAEGAKGAERVHLTLSDDAAVDEVLEQARAGFDEDVVIVDHTTTSPAGAAARVHIWDEQGFAFLHAPVFMGPKNARNATGYMLASGDPELFDQVQPELARMTGQLVYLGPRPDRAAAFKLLGNLFLIAMTSGLIDMLALAKAMGLKPGEAASFLDGINLGASAPARIRRILEADFTVPSFELGMARKDARLMIETAEQAGIDLSVIPAIAAVMDRWIDDGHAHDDWTILARPVT
ncbi:MAG: NAD(P)-dependent oxidoreductase [Gemmatimonadota bacterium]|jgi:3-hydroxyisobutyrate dehydrogenase